MQQLMNANAEKTQKEKLQDQMHIHFTVLFLSVVSIPAPVSQTHRMYKGHWCESEWVAENDAIIKCKSENNIFSPMWD